MSDPAKKRNSDPTRMAADSEHSGEEAASAPHNSDLCERRRQQNREAQRRFRNKRTQQRLAEAQAALAHAHPAQQDGNGSGSRDAHDVEPQTSSRASLSGSGSQSMPSNISSNIVSTEAPLMLPAGHAWNSHNFGLDMPPNPILGTLDGTQPVLFDPRFSLPTTPFGLPPSSDGFAFTFDPDQPNLLDHQGPISTFCAPSLTNPGSSSATSSRSAVGHSDVPDFLGNSSDVGFPDIAALDAAIMQEIGEFDPNKALLHDWFETGAPFVDDLDFPPLPTSVLGTSTEGTCSPPTSDAQSKSREGQQSSAARSSSYSDVSLRSPTDIRRPSSHDNSPRPLLHLSIESGHESIVRVLLDSGVDINERDGDGAAGVHIAVKTRQDGILRLLLERGADVNVVDNNDKTPTHLAITTGFETGLRLLLNRGVTIATRRTSEAS